MEKLFINPTLMQDSLSNEMEHEFAEMLDTFHSQQEVWDNDLDRQIHEWYANAPNVFPKYPYFSPSAVTSCPMSLYFKYKKAEKDNLPRQPHQSRWQSAGTATGDWLQRDILLIEKHFERLTGEKPKFKFERTDKGEPMFEEFAKVNHPVEFVDEETGEMNKFYLLGAPDGIMTYTPDGSDKPVRVGIEIKSKQTTSAKTSKHSMRTAEEGHIAQSIAYSVMYDVDYYLIVYVNLSKKSWEYTEEDYEKSPDLRVFGYHFDDKTKSMVLDYLSNLLVMFQNDDIPTLDITSWTFNNYKIQCAINLTDEQLQDIVDEVELVENDKYTPQYKKRNYRKVLDDITFIRKFYEGTRNNLENGTIKKK